MGGREPDMSLGNLSGGMSLSSPTMRHLEELNAEEGQAQA